MKPRICRWHIHIQHARDHFVSLGIHALITFYKNRNWTFGFRVVEAFQFSLLHDNTKLHARIVVYSSNYQHIYTHQSLYVCTKLYSYNFFILFFIILSVLWWFKLLFRVDFSKVFWYLMKYYWMNYVWVFRLLGIIQFWIICL